MYKREDYFGLLMSMTQRSVRDAIEFTWEAYTNYGYSLKLSAPKLQSPVDWEATERSRILFWEPQPDGRTDGNWSYYIRFSGNWYSITDRYGFNTLYNAAWEAHGVIQVHKLALALLELARQIRGYGEWVLRQAEEDVEILRAEEGIQGLLAIQSLAQ